MLSMWSRFDHSDRAMRTRLKGPLLPELAHIDMDRNRTPPGIGPARHWIDGEWVGSFTVERSVNPWTGEVLAQFSAGGRIEAAAAVSAVRTAFNVSA